MQPASGWLVTGIPWPFCPNCASSRFMDLTDRLAVSYCVGLAAIHSLFPEVSLLAAFTINHTGLCKQFSLNRVSDGWSCMLFVPFAITTSGGICVGFAASYLSVSPERHALQEAGQILSHMRQNLSGPIGRVSALGCCCPSSFFHLSNTPSLRFLFAMRFPRNSSSPLLM